MTPGEIRWIKKHTEKTLKELNMKSNKKTVAHTKNPIVGKLLRLKYKMNEAYRNGNKPAGGDTDTRTDKTWVMNLISDVRNNNLTKLCKEDILHCNGLWRKYEGK